MLDYMLLGLLRHQPMSGYDLKQLINASIAHFWHAKISQIYRTLKKMEKKAWVTSHMEPQTGRPDRRVYTVTETGLEALEVWQQAYVTEPDEIKLSSLLKLFFMGRGVDKQTILTQLRLWQDMYQRQLIHFQEELPEQITTVSADMDASAKDVLFWEATRRFGERYHQMQLDWLEEVRGLVEAEVED